MSLYVRDVGNGRSTNATTLVIPLTATPAVGNDILLELSWNGTATTASNAVADTDGVFTWTKDKSDTTSGTRCTVEIWRGTKNTGDLVSGKNITITFTIGNTTGKVGVLREMSGILTLDKSAVNHGASSTTSLTVGATAATTTAAEIVWASFSTAVVQASWTPDGSYTVPTLNVYTDSNNQRTLLSEYQDVSSTGAQTATGTAASATTWASTIVTYSSSANTGAAPANTGTPAVTGTPTVGQALTTTDGSWSGTPAPTFGYQWQRDNTGGGSYSDIGSATSNSYTLVDADDGCNVRCVVTATNASGNASANSNSVGLVVEPAPANSVAPAVTGTATVGQTLTTDHGTFTNIGGVTPTYAYQWQRDGHGDTVYANISSATATTYVLVNADDGCNVRCQVTATNTGGSASANSNVKAIVEPAPSNSVVPALGGFNAQVGKTITATTGTWANMAGYQPTFTYQWQDSADGSTSWGNITAATSATYDVAAAEATKYLRCVVTAHNSNTTASANSVASNQVAAAATAGHQRFASTVATLLILDSGRLNSVRSEL